MNEPIFSHESIFQTVEALESAISLADESSLQAARARLPEKDNLPHAWQGEFYKYIRQALKGRERELESKRGERPHTIRADIAGIAERLCGLLEKIPNGEMASAGQQIFAGREETLTATLVCLAVAHGLLERSKKSDRVKTLNADLTPVGSADEAVRAALGISVETWARHNGGVPLSANMATAGRTLALHLELSALRQLPADLLVMPWGTNETAKGRVIVNETTLRVMPTVMKASNLDRIQLDFEHNTVPGHENYRGEPTKIAGMGTAVVEAKTGIWFRGIEWTPEGRQFIAAGHYRDLSPVVTLNAADEVIAITSVAACRAGATTGLGIPLSAPLPSDSEAAVRLALGISPEAWARHNS